MEKNTSKKLLILLIACLCVLVVLCILVAKAFFSPRTREVTGKDTADTAAQTETTADPSDGTDASAGITSAQVADVLNQAFEMEGYTGAGNATAEDDCVTVRELTAYAFEEYRQAMETDPEGELASSANQFFAKETAYWQSLFSEISAKTGYAGKFSFVIVFSDGYECPVF